MANTLTAIRLLLVVPIGILMAAANEWAATLAAAALLVAITTDLADGPLARRLGTATSLGRIFDHTTDCLFVTSGLAGGIVRGVVPWVLPVLVLAAFTQYAVDSYRLQGRLGLRSSRLGRYNGVFYFAPLCGDTLVRVGLTFLRPAVTAVCWTLVVTTCLSIGERFMLLRQARQRGLASPVEETGDQSPH